MKFCVKILLVCACVVFIFSCASFRPIKGEQMSTLIAAPGVKSATQLTNFFLANNPQSDKKKIKKLATYYVHEGAYEGINSDVAFVQMCLETGFLRYGGLVTADMNNFCGLGSIDSTNRGERFATPQLGVRAHIQHLHAYGTTVPLKGKLIDNRYKYVQPRGKAPDIFGLSGTWASDKQYGDKLYGLLVKLNNF